MKAFHCRYKRQHTTVTGVRNAHHAKTRAAWEFNMPPAQIHLIEAVVLCDAPDFEFEDAILTRPGESLVDTTNKHRPDRK